MIAVIDYDAGNLKSVEKALLYLGARPVFTRDERVITDADHVILPGVGCYGDAMGCLKDYGLVELIRKTALSGKPFLGICLGMQLLFEASQESPEAKGLSVLQGQIIGIPDGQGRKVPHMGWNSLNVNPNSRLLKDLGPDPYVYFVHSYYLQARHLDQVAAHTQYGVDIHAAVECDNLCGCQFHPEKSGDTGLQILRNFISMK